MRNNGERPQGGVARLGRSNGLFPTSFRTLSGYLRTVSSGASSVASTVRSAGASVASSIADRIDDSSSDQVQWSGFDKLECERDNTRQVLLLGYCTGFQVWDVEEADNVRELVSMHDGSVSFLQLQPKPIASKSVGDKFADQRPLLVVVRNGSPSGSGNNVQDMSAFPHSGNITNGFEPGNGAFIPSVVRFYSLRSQSYVRELKFRSAVYSVRCSSRVVAISQAAQIHCFDTATLEMEYNLLTYPLVSNSLGSGGIGCGPLAVGPRWLAYSGSPLAVSNTGRVNPQHLAPSASFSGSPSNGSLVAHYAKESSKHLAAGIVTLGDIGYKKLSRYCSELLPDSNNLSPTSITNGNGHLSDTDNAGMVIVRDIVYKSVIAQFRAHRNPISALCFDPSGILLVTASIQGHNINIFQIMPTHVGSSSEFDSDRSYTHLYKLQRGLTNAVIQDISFSMDSHWIMVSSARGTNHLFAISPSGGAVLQPCGLGVTNFNHGSGVTSKPLVKWPPSSGASKLNQPSFCASGPPITLSAVGRIKNGNNGWRGTVTGAAAAAAGRVSSLSGATASAFHNCKRINAYADTNLSRTKYHLLVFSPSGSVIQYVLRPSSGLDGGPIVSGSAVLFDCPPDSDARIVIEPLQKWDICQRRSRREREDNSDVYGEYGNVDSSKIYPERITEEARYFLSAKGTPTKTKINSEERHHMYISEAELQMHELRMPLWAKPEVYFQTMVMDEFEMENGNASGGEIEMERTPVRMIEARSKNLIPVYDYLQTHKLQQSRAPSLESNRSALHQKFGMSEDGRLSCRSSCSLLDSMSEGVTSTELRSGIEDNGWGDYRVSMQPTENSVNNDVIPKKETCLDYVNNRERPKMENNVEFVNNNKESLKTDNHLIGHDDELD